MLSRSSFNLLNPDDYSCAVDPRIPRFMTIPGILSEFDEDNIGKFNGKNEAHHSSGVISSVTPKRRIVVSNQLPVFEYDPDALVLQLKFGFGPDVEVVYVGSLSVDIDPSEQEEVAQRLLDKFRCLPTFLFLESRINFIMASVSITYGLCFITCYL
ncbi:hypothetical protein Ccrd_009822 [Cynara cardunculus var. scolymus]|uniref:Uncharacterized protein n=1 Tax=Cynara cardunculus var. scolymus TaxID=59895 RepID=A0A118K762_CYNCS|nr:hypothetical protein Ccrd_009822 [Cynara cardunculus var. scolymus]